MESLFFLKKKKEALRSKSRRDRQSTTLIQLHGPGLEAWRAPSFLKIENEESGENDEEDHDLDGSHWHPLGSCAGGRS